VFSSVFGLADPEEEEEWACESESGSKLISKLKSSILLLQFLEIPEWRLMSHMP
jgi:hypothetical protein